MPTNKVSVSFKSQKDRHLITTLEDFARAINSLVDESGGSGTSGETKVVSSVKGWYDTIYPLGGGGKLDQKRDLFIHPGRKYEMLTGDAAGLKWGWENFCTSVGLEAGPLGAGEYNTHLGFRAGREELNGEANTFLGALAGYNSGATAPMDEDAETVTWSLAVNTTASATPALFSTGDRLYYCRRNTSSEGELLYSEDGVDFTNSVTTFTAPNTIALTGFFTFIIEYKGSLFWNSYGDSSNIQEWNGSSVTNHLNVNNYHAASAHVFNNKLWVCTTVTPFVNDNDIIVYYYDGTSWTAVTDYDGAAHFSDDCNSSDIALNHGHQLHRWIEYNSSLYLIVERWTGGTTWTTHVLKWDGTSAFDTVATITVSGDAYAHVTAGVWLGSTYYLFLSRFESNGSIKNTLADRRVYVYTSSNMTTWTHVGTISGDISFAADAILWDGRLMIAGVNYTTQDTSVGRLDMSDYTLTEEALVDINTHCRFFAPFMGRLFLSGYDIYGQNKGCIYERENLIADDIVAATPANVMIGAAAGWSNVTGQHNVIIGALADVATSDLDNAIAIGYMAKVAKSNVMALGGTGDYAVNVAIGKVTADYALDVLGSARVSSQFISTLATGTKPIDVTSTTLCTNLNADKWEGYDLSVSGLADKDLMMYSTGSSAWVNASLLGIEDLTDPDSDRIMFWDDSAGYVTWLSVDGTSLGINNTTITVIPGGIDHGSLAGLGDNDHTQYVLHSLDTSEGGILVGTGIGAFTYLARGTEGQVLYCDDETALWGDHGTIAGLLDDDHTQYLLANGTRLLTGDWSAGGYKIETRYLQADGNPSASGSEFSFLSFLSDRNVAAAETNYIRGAVVSGSSVCDIASGITDSGYRMGIDISMHLTTANFEGTLTEQYGMRLFHGQYSGATGTITTAYGMMIRSFAKVGTIGTLCQLYMDADLSGGSVTTKYGIYQANSSLGNIFLGPVSMSGSLGDAALMVYRGSYGQGTAVFCGTNINSHFNYSSTEDTYLRGGKATSKMYIHDTCSGLVSIANGGGNVGIGTTAPDTKLHLKGSLLELRFEEDTAGVCVDMRCNASGAFIIEQNKDAADQHIYIRPTMTGHINTKHLIVGDQGGFVGVGGVPACHLDVAGTLRSTDYQSPASGVGLEMGYYDTGSYAFVFGCNRTTTAAVELRLGGPYTGYQLVLKADGKVGVGTSSPNELFTVEGVVSLKETTAPSSTANYGKIYVKSSDSLPYFLRDDGVEFGFLTTDGLARAWRSGSQTNTASGWQKVQLNAETFDVGSDFDSTTNYRFTAPYTGYYQVNAGVTYNTVTAAVIAAALSRNGTTMTRLGHASVAASSIACFSGSDIIYMTAGQYLELYYYCSATDGVVYGAALSDTYMSVRFVNP